MFTPAGLGIMLAYAGYCMFTLARQDPRIFGFFELSKILRGILLYYTVANYMEGQKQAEELAIALTCSMIYEGFFALFQRYKMGVNRVPGSFDHANSLSIYCIMCGAAVICCAFSDAPLRRRALYGLGALVAVLAVVLTQSRTGFITLLAICISSMALCGLFKPTRNNMILLACVLLAVGGIVGKSWKTISERMAENANEITDDPTEGRGYYFNLAKLIVADYPLGCGLNNWSYYVTNHYGGVLGMEYNAYHSLESAPDREIPYGSKDLAQAAPAHSLIALTMGELGYPGLVLLGSVWLRWLSIAATGLLKRNEKLVSRIAVGLFLGLVGCLFQSQTEWEFRQTAPFFIAHIFAGSAAGLMKMRQDKKLAKTKPPLLRPTPS